MMIITFPPLIASADSHPAALWQMTQPLLGRNNIEILLQGHCEEYARHLADKITHILPTFKSSLEPDTVEITGTLSNLVIWR